VIRLNLPNKLIGTPLKILILKQIKVYEGNVTSNNVNALVKLRWGNEESSCQVARNNALP
jgi:hypothetical protein